MNSTILSSSKCMKCGKIATISELEDNPEGVGKVCSDTIKCNEGTEKLKKTREIE